MLTAEQRRARARLAALTRWSKPFARADQAAAAGAALRRRIAAQVDPDGKLPPEELAAVTRSALRAYSVRLNAAKAAKKRLAVAATATSPKEFSVSHDPISRPQYSGGRDRTGPGSRSGAGGCG